jgi:hypothetical protein
VAFVGKGQVLYWLSIAVLAFAPLGLAFGPLGLFDGGRGE